MSSRPFDEADDADLADQQRSVVTDDDAPPTRPTAPLDQANEADALEQGAEVTGDDEEYEHGR
jgi:hypothetical protein